MMQEHMGARPAGAPRRNVRDMADLQQLIRYVERWRMAHFQRPDDSRLRDADELLRKLRRGLAMAAQNGMGRGGPAWAS
jgi:hypothetical protein